jgi:hypothetical protein
MHWLKENTPRGAMWHGQAPEGTWEIQETAEGYIGIPPAGQAYPYPLVAGLFQSDRSLAAAQILAQEASLWAAAAYPQTDQSATCMGSFTIICAGEAFLITRSDDKWHMTYEQAGVQNTVEATSLIELMANLPEIFAQRDMAARQTFSDEQDRGRKRAVLAEKHADAVEDSSVVKRMMSRAGNSAASRMKSVEYAFRAMRQVELRQMSLLNQARSTRVIAA